MWSKQQHNNYDLPINYINRHGSDSEGQRSDPSHRSAGGYNRPPMDQNQAQYQQVIRPGS